MHFNTSSPHDDPGDLHYALWNFPAVDVDIAAQLVGVSPSIVYRQIRATGEAFDGVPARKVGRRYVIPTKPLRVFLMCDEPHPSTHTGQAANRCRA